MVRNISVRENRRFSKAADYGIHPMFKGSSKKEAKKMSLFFSENSIVLCVLIMKFELKRMKGEFNQQYKVYLLWK